MTEQEVKKMKVIIQKDVLPVDSVSTQIINKGTGAGGSNTNKNGLSYEEKTDLTFEFTKINGRELSYNEKNFIKTNKTSLHKYMNSINEKNLEILPAAGCKSPDEAYINNASNSLFIIEKKFQQGTGSVDEKIQTGLFKKEHYGELFPNYKIHYIYCLSDWFKRDEYSSVLKYLKKNNIPIFWGNDTNYKSEIIQYIFNNSL